MSEVRDVQAIVDVATRAAGPRPLSEGTLNVVVVPEGYVAQVVDDREKYDARAAAPRRTKGTAYLTRAQSFTAYVQGHRSEQDSVTLWANADAHTITAVFNGAQPFNGAPGWGDDRAVLTMKVTPEWRDWKEMNGKLVGQAAFAQFIEDHMGSVVDPDGATLLEMVQQFEAVTNVQFKAAHRLKDGQRQITYVENTTSGTGVGGEIEFPANFLLDLAIFDGLEAEAVGARVRYRLGAGNLSIGFMLDDIETQERLAFDTVLAAVEQDTNMVAMHGALPR